MVDRSRAGARGTGGSGRKLALVLVLSAGYAAVGWFGPGSGEEFEAFYAKNPVLLAALAIATTVALAAVIAIAIVALSGVVKRRSGVPGGRRVDVPAPPPPLVTRPGAQPRPSRPPRPPACDRLAASSAGPRRSLPTKAGPLRGWLRRELPQGAVATYAALAVHAALVVTDLLHQPYSTGSLVGHAVSVAAPLAGWCVLMMSDYVQDHPLVVEERDAPAPAMESRGVIGGKEEERQRPVGRLVARIMAGAVLLGVLASRPQLALFIPAFLVIWGVDLMIQVVLLHERRSEQLSNRKETDSIMGDAIAPGHPET
ncbi:MAG: hypothetical protein JW839_21620 [Candidatus Lokiarchaeota archaeon]|nr:hypothetical protein [Candidatus Lokiarchaeota archaeon]